ncbi:thiamine pyrophosphate enzyme, N-terminal TPP binding domain-containing protein [Chaetomidium leptoderma]|uniref:Thiamine pyrophosphate enzyme, N-terminal TPP binding domain-containing protein n=1 Tax=Chaetomidium leptoderma TaxID=669021 RepID=A0AAN6VEH1_9PEZI|nr:thiamine pyrophosphate enzyme, N-terminal TPP binding domain-containing protein [Chaetomidium leptoderma]
MYTTSFAFFEAIADAGVSHCFVNLGSDHPSIIEAMVVQKSNPKFPRIITCPSEMVAMSMADGYARLTGKAQCVIVHVDVGTQALGVAVHNASSGRCPVLVFAGLSPFTQEGELRGSRSEFIHWLQDVPDQRAIVAQYCRYTNELRTGVNVKQMVNRALQFASSSPQGPVYLCAGREVLEAEIEPYEMSLGQRYWEPVELGGLPPKGARRIAEALAGASRPLLVTGYSGRNHEIPKALVELADTISALRVLDTAGSDMCFPADHPAWLGAKQQGADASIPEADVILVLDCDVPWIPTLCKPRPDATVFHIDTDPLKQRMPLFYIQADARYQADSLLSVQQILEILHKPESEAARILTSQNLAAAAAEATRRRESYAARIESIEKAAAGPLADGKFGVAHLSRLLRSACPEDTVWVVEAVTNTGFIHDNVRPTRPGSWINCGGGGLGWSGGAALGIKLAADAEGRGQFVCQIVGDGTYLFSIPGSVYWIAHRYNIPVLTIVLNNNGWNAPRKSYMMVHPKGAASKVSDEDIHISFAPPPDYAGIAAAAGAGDVHALKVEEASQLAAVLEDAVAKVQAGNTTVVDCRIVAGY